MFTSIEYNERSIAKNAQFARLRYQYNTVKKECQAPEVLHDVSSSGKVRKWSYYKGQNMYIAYAYEQFDQEKYEKLLGCGTWLQYAADRNSGRLTLKSANFCRLRLCPICQWRRSLKLYGQMRRVIEHLGGDYLYIFWTGTIRNCGGSELSQSITHLLEGFKCMAKMPEFKRACKGYFRALEVTRNTDTGDFHPHIHAIFAVRRSYFTSRDYLAQTDWTALWLKALNECATRCKCARLDYAPIVNVKRVKARGGAQSEYDGGPVDTIAAICETAKYCVKSEDIICYDDWDLTVDTLKTLDSALSGRRLISMGGIIRQAHHDLNLTSVDSEDSDLLDIGQDESIANPDNANELLYVWHSGYSEYVRKD